MQVLELFSGSRSLGKVAEEMGHDVCSSDIHSFNGTDLVCDILDFDVNKVPFVPDMIWASPLCEFFSLNAGSTYWLPGYVPKPNNIGPALVKKAQEIIKQYDCLYVIENPLFMLRKMPFMDGWPRTTVCYCQYSGPIDRGPGKDTRPDMKRTDLWNNIGFEGRMCHNGNPDHRPAPRGKYYGDSYEVRSQIPVRLCEEIMIACEVSQ